MKIKPFKAGEKQIKEDCREERSIAAQNCYQVQLKVNALLPNYPIWLADRLPLPDGYSEADLLLAHQILQHEPVYCGGHPQRAFGRGQ
jgi:hypothetical protein